MRLCELHVSILCLPALFFFLTANKFETDGFPLPVAYCTACSKCNVLNISHIFEWHSNLRKIPFQAYMCPHGVWQIRSKLSGWGSSKRHNVWFLSIPSHCQTYSRKVKIAHLLTEINVRGGSRTFPPTAPLLGITYIPNNSMLEFTKEVNPLP